jgi:hypothetical protein
VIHDYPLKTSESSWKACGTVLPVFSIRSETGFGIGDIGDIRKLIDWAVKTGQHFIQLLPMNDTTRSHTRQDSYPEDPCQSNHYHPRIAADRSYAYRELPDDDRQAVERLYNDFYFLRHNEYWKQTALNRLTPLC